MSDFQFPEPGDDRMPARWAKNPPRKADPDLPDLIEVMQPMERDYWSEGGQSHRQREAFLARIEARWRRWKDIAWQLKQTNTEAEQPTQGKSPKTQRRPPKLNLQPLHDEIERASRVMGEATKILSRKAKPEDRKPAQHASGNATTHDPKVSWVHRIPVWREFGPWLRWASASFAFALGMTQINEYGWALVGLAVCGICCLAQIYVWTASPNRFKNVVAKAVLAVLSLSLIGISALTVVNIRQDKPWSNVSLTKKRVDGESAIQQASDRPIEPQSQPSTTPVSSPLPSPTAPAQPRVVSQPKAKPVASATVTPTPVPTQETSSSTEYIVAFKIQSSLEPLEKVRVIITNVNTQVGYSTQAISVGDYSMATIRLPEGTYTAKVAYKGFSGETRFIVKGRGGLITINVK